MLFSRAGKRSALDDALAVGAPVITLVLIISYLVRHEFAVDFQHQFWVAGHRVLYGPLGPYAWTHAQIASGVGAFPYPALPALLFVPFALLPKLAAALLWVGLSIAALVLTLRTLAVRDWRAYALAFLWWPMIIGWQSGNVTLVLALILAAVWRYRDRPIIAGLLVAAAVSLKPFMWPVFLWLVATRRYRAGASALGMGIILNLIAWATVGFDQLSRYLHLDSAVTSALYRDGYGVISLVWRLGASRTAGTVALVIVAVILAAACLILARRDREAHALAIAVLLAISASPLSWMHYLVLLIVPLAVLQPRVSAVWLLPLVLWLCPGGLRESLWQVLLFYGVTAAMMCLMLKRQAAPGSASQERRTGQAHVLATAQGGERAG